MKKLLSIIIAVVFVASMCAVAISAQSYNPGGHCEIEFKVKKADPANVIKDGCVGENEYEKLDVDLNPEETQCILVYGSNTAMYTCAEEMLATMEYYFSWDEVHGFNFAVKCKPGEYTQTIPVKDGDVPGDDFLCNFGIQVDFEQMLNCLSRDQGLFYYSLSKNAQTGEYMEGYYTQLGLKGVYDPEPEKDYAINFNDDGSVTFEWSIPFDNYLEGAPTDGTKVYFNIGVLAGTDTTEELHTNTYGVGLGDYIFLGDRRMIPEPQCATAILSDETIALIADPDTKPTTDTDNPGTDPADTTNPGTDPVDTTNPGTDPVDTDNPGTDPVNPADPENPSNPSNPTNPSNPGNKAPSTADPIVIAAIASAVSACGFMVSKKRK